MPLANSFWLWTLSLDCSWKKNNVWQQFCHPAFILYFVFGPTFVRNCVNPKTKIQIVWFLKCMSSCLPLSFPCWWKTGIRRSARLQPAWVKIWRFFAACYNILNHSTKYHNLWLRQNYTLNAFCPLVFKGGCSPACLPRPQKQSIGLYLQPHYGELWLSTRGSNIFSISLSASPLFPVMIIDLWHHL